MSQRSLTIALFVSLAVNLFAIGAVVGGLVIGVRMSEGRESAMRPGPPPIFSAASALPEARQDAYREALRGEAREVRRSLMRAGEARRAAWGDIAADPYDPAAVRQALTEAQAIEAQARSRLESRIVDFAADLSPEERQALAQALSRPPARHGDGRGGGESRRDRF
ncbi:MAG: periplasmic heavy metal sensor [Phenylobacterium sp.]|uniref:periplasmic heavy metal sensor n=1 Tax=Phenylobacterium sp. TaxID=1871053 RepID=UPI0027375053|nr:periplasmic heavy metal sensor [Phenylobacterium sp.]MDP1643408.1 periplasmic heavy metal sensor [Phenylobacterium sp.]MDP3116778.1 periplasmic heavy metal sensor [Phenylobacterium sp.]MDP3382371.1 periplasmic heavy metal sensor [Phenylobacterium sp.]